MKKIISVLLTLAMLISLCATNVVMAADIDASITETGTTPYYFDVVSNFNTTQRRSKIYLTADRIGVDSKADKTDFLGTGQTNGTEVAAILWPPVVSSTPEGDATNKIPPTRGSISFDEDTQTAYLTSNLSGATYKLPGFMEDDINKTDNQPEALILCPLRARLTWMKAPLYCNLIKDISCNVKDDSYDELSLIIATDSCETTYDDTNWKYERMKIQVNYTDGTNSYTIAQNDANIPTPTLERHNVNAKQGAYGYVYTVLPWSNGGQVPISRDNFLMRLDTLHSKSDEKMSDTSDTRTLLVTGLTNNSDNYKDIMVFEYILKPDPLKTVKSISINTYSDFSTEQLRGVALLGVAGKPAVLANPATVEAGKVTVKAATEVAGKVIGAVYEGDKLVATGEKTYEAGVPADIVINDTAIKAGTDYDVKLFIWETDGSFKPLTQATTVRKE